MAIGLVVTLALGVLGAEPPVDSLAAYRGPVQRILAAAQADQRAYDHLVELCDDIGHRLSGSPQLDQAIAWAQRVLRADGHENVRAEPVMVPRWVRGQESLALVAPRAAPMALLGLGGTPGTPAGGLEAEVVVVKDEADLEAHAAELKGRIVVFNHPMPQHHPEKGSSYGRAVRYRYRGPVMAAAHGAVAVLVRSVTPNSLYTPHTGATQVDAPTIPSAAITAEDAELLARFQRRGIRARVRLSLGARDEGLVPSANVVADLVGRELPEEIVIISGHLDSWDVGQGAHDDGAGVVMAMQALTVLRSLGLRPRRTVRVVLWTNEENGLRGARQYAEDHAKELAKHVAAIEADTGCFEPVGYRVDHVDPARRMRAVEALEDYLGLLEPVGATLATAAFAGADVSPLKDSGVLLLGHHMNMDTYFDVHHTAADTVDKVNPQVLSRNVAAMAATAWLLAELPSVP